MDPKNHRTISLLPLLPKIIEKKIMIKLRDFLSKNDVLFKYKSGYRTNHSTDFAFSFLSDKISRGFDNGFLNGMILIPYYRKLTNQKTNAQKINAVCRKSAFLEHKINTISKILLFSCIKSTRFWKVLEKKMLSCLVSTIFL